MLKLLFSFRGVIARRPFLIGNGVALGALIAFASATSLIFAISDPSTHFVDILDTVALAITPPFAWPFIALTLKRLRDLGLSTPAATALMMTPITITLALPLSYGFIPFSAAIVVYCAMQIWSWTIFMVCCIRREPFGAPTFRSPEIDPTLL